MKLKLTQRHANLQKLYKVSQRGRERNRDIFLKLKVSATWGQ